MHFINTNGDLAPDGLASMQKTRDTSSANSVRTTSRIAPLRPFKKVGSIGTANPSRYNEYLQYVPIICSRFDLKLVPYVRQNFPRNHSATLVVFPV